VVSRNEHSRLNAANGFSCSERHFVNVTYLRNIYRPVPTSKKTLHTYVNKEQSVNYVEENNLCLYEKHTNAILYSH
jgi:hypothetical protein